MGWASSRRLASESTKSMWAATPAEIKTMSRMLLEPKPDGAARRRAAES